MSHAGNSDVDLRLPALLPGFALCFDPVEPVADFLSFSECAMSCPRSVFGGSDAGMMFKIVNERDEKSVPLNSAIFARMDDHCGKREPFGVNDVFPRTLKGRNNMNIIIILVVGGILGWLASIIMRTDGQQGIFLNVIVGIVGAFLAGFIITPLIGGAPITSGSFDIRSLIASFLGAVVLLAIVNMFRRGRVR